MPDGGQPDGARPQGSISRANASRARPGDQPSDALRSRSASWSGCVPPSTGKFTTPASGELPSGRWNHPRSGETVVVPGAQSSRLTLTARRLAASSA